MSLLFNLIEIKNFGSLDWHFDALVALTNMEKIIFFNKCIQRADTCPLWFDDITLIYHNNAKTSLQAKKPNYKSTNIKKKHVNTFGTSFFCQCALWHMDSSTCLFSWFILNIFFLFFRILKHWLWNAKQSKFYERKKNTHTSNNIKKNYWNLQAVHWTLIYYTAYSLHKFQFQPTNA